MNASNIEYYAGTDLELSVRSFNILKRHDINNIVDLLDVRLFDLYQFCNFNQSDYQNLLHDIAKLFDAYFSAKGGK